MTGGRFLILLILVATGLLAAALTITTGDNSVGLASAGADAAAIETQWFRDAAALANIFAPTSRGETSALLIGLIAGWLLRWGYSLPWSSIPRTVADWLLGWRTSAAMLGLAVGCTVILLFY